MANNNNRPDIDFENDLWKAADELRGAVAENQYKDFVLSLIFIKHLSERYMIRKDEILAKCNNPNDDYYTTDKEEISYILSDPDEHLSKGVYMLPVEATWEYLQENVKMAVIKVKVDQDTWNYRTCAVFFAARPV
jgi:type I restriction enzyme M protein